MKAKWISLLFLPLGIVLLSLLPGLLSPASGREPVSLMDYLPTPRPSEPCDLCEPNDSWNQACGPLAPGKNYQYPIRCTDNPGEYDDDLYYIDLKTAGIFTVNLTDIPSGTDYSVFVYDEDHQLLLPCSSDNGGNDDEHATCYLSRLGRYFVRIYPWIGCDDDNPYALAVAYPTPPPTPVPTSTSTPPCNLHIDDFGDLDPVNDLGEPSGWELVPSGCGSLTVSYTGSELELDYDLTSGECTARYITMLSLGASPYEMLAFEIKGDDEQELASTIVGLRDEKGHEMRVQVGGFLSQIVTDTWQGVNLPLAAFTTVDTSQLDTFFFELTNVPGGTLGPGRLNRGTIYLDSLRLESPYAPLIVDNFNDLSDPNALGGGFGVYYTDTATFETAYIADDTYDDSPGSYVISYTLPSGAWALWETYLPGLDVSDYAFLSFYVKGADGGEKVNLYLEDGDERKAYEDVENYTPAGIVDPDNGAIDTDWALVRVPLQAFEGVALTDLAKIKFVFEWEPMTGTVFLDDLRFIADTLLVDNFCDSDESNSLNSEVGLFASTFPCTSAVTSTISGGALRLDYDVAAGPGCYSGYWSQTRLDLNPYRTLAVKVRGEHCGEVASISARTGPVATDKLKLSDYLLDGITDQWQKTRIPLAASSVVTDWTRGESYVIAFEENQGASKGTTWWDDVVFETACAPIWVDNFNDEDNRNALRGLSYIIEQEAEVASFTTITQSYGDAGAALGLTYAVPVGATKYAGWGTSLRSVDLSNYDLLVFNIKGEVGGEKPNVYLRDDSGVRKHVDIESYAPVSTMWQTIVIPLRDFDQDPLPPYEYLDWTQIQDLEFIIEWEATGVEGTFYLDNIHLLPAVGCSQITQNQVFLPMIANNYTPLILDPIWDFESDTEGWATYSTITYCRAVTDVMTSTFRSIWGDASLALIVNLDGSSSRLNRGAAYVDVPEDLPSEVSGTVDLACKPLSCWIYVPTCGLGDPDNLNTVRLFVKDVNDYDEYGAPMQVVRNRWFEVSLRPSTLEPYNGSMEEGFDPHAITRLGIQFKAGSSETTYRGKVYVDACGWQEIDSISTMTTGVCGSDGCSERISGTLPNAIE